MNEHVKKTIENVAYKISKEHTNSTGCFVFYQPSVPNALNDDSIKRFISESTNDSDKKDIYIYAIELIKIYFCTFSIVTLLSTILKTFDLTFLFVINFILIRKYVGGFHLKSKIKCFFTTIVLFITIPFFINKVNLIKPEFDCLVILAYLILVFLIVPVCPHKNIKTCERKNLKLKALFMLIIMVFEILFFQTNYLRKYHDVIIGSLILNILNMIIAFLYINSNKRNYNDTMGGTLC